MSYHLLGLAGYLGYFSIFVSIFTAGHLWERMFVWMPADSSLIAAVFGIIGIILMVI